MTGPIWARQAIMLAGMLALCSCAIGGAALMQAGSAALVARFDADGDGMLSAGEVKALVAATVPGKGAEFDALRAGLLAGYMARDCDADGRLTAAEIMAPGDCTGTGA